MEVIILGDLWIIFLDQMDALTLNKLGALYLKIDGWEML